MSCGQIWLRDHRDCRRRSGPRFVPSCACHLCWSRTKKSNKNGSYSSETNFPTGNHLNYTTINKKKNRNEIKLRHGNKWITGCCLSPFCFHLRAFSNSGNVNVRPDLNYFKKNRQTVFTYLLLNRINIWCVLYLCNLVNVFRYGRKTSIFCHFHKLHNFATHRDFTSQRLIELIFFPIYVNRLSESITHVRNGLSLLVQEVNLILCTVHYCGYARNFQNQQGDRASADWLQQ